MTDKQLARVLKLIARQFAQLRNGAITTEIAHENITEVIFSLYNETKG